MSSCLICHNPTAETNLGGEFLCVNCDIELGEENDTN